MNLSKFLTHVNNGKSIPIGSEIHKFMVKLSHEAMKITGQLNSSYHENEEIQELFSQLTGKKVDKTFMIFSPFYTDCGKNITIGKNVFINYCCHFQDQGGISIGDGTLIGPKVTLATLNHGTDPKDRGTTYPDPIVIGKNVWIGTNVTVVPGVTIGDSVITAAGAVVTKNIPENSIAEGVPARILKKIEVDDRDE